MAASISNFDDFKLETEFRLDCVVHTTRDRKKLVWKKVGMIGEGAFGRVWLQENQDGGQVRAVKTVPLKSLSQEGFSQELLAFVKLRDHEDLFVKFLGWYQGEHDIFFTMEYLKNGDLSQYMIKDPSNAKENAKEVTLQILRGLDVLFKENICHRDLKPQNVLVASLIPIHVKISDFGVAKETSSTTARTGWGTDNYRAPEILGLLPRKLQRRRFIGHALDIWSLGSLVHELLTSQTPFLALPTDEGSDSDSEPETGVATNLPHERRTDMSSFQDYCHGKIGFPCEVLRNSQVSEDGITFIKDLLTANPKGRPTAAGALGHAWLWEEGSSSLQKWMEAGNVSRVSILLEGEADIASMDCREGFMLALKAGCPNMIKVFLRKGVEIKDSPHVVTAFQLAVEGGDLEMCALLLGAGASPNVIPRDTWKELLELAARSGHLQIARLVLGHNPDVDGVEGICCGTEALAVAAWGGHLDMVKLLLDNKADVNAQPGSRHGTALYEAAEGGHLEIVKFLLDNKANVNAHPGYGHGTALQVATLGGHLDVVKLLLDNKADVGAEALSNGTSELDDIKSRDQAHEDEKMTLRQQIQALEDQLQHAAPPTGGLANGLVNFVSNKKPKRRSAEVGRLEGDGMYRSSYQTHPVSMMPQSAPIRSRDLGALVSSPSEREYELHRILEDDEELSEEVAIGLIRNLKIPQPQNPLLEKEVLFPAYIINVVTSEMWNNVFVKESERFLANVMQSIQHEVMAHDGNDAINQGAFWLSNVHEMLSFAFLAEEWYGIQEKDDYGYKRLLEIVKYDLESLEFNIYYTWMKVLKRRLHEMIVPAIIESQSLPGFITNDGNRFLNKPLQTSSTPAYSMDDLLSFLNKICEALRWYFIEDSIITQAVTELLKLIGVTAFNDLLLRRNFLSWKRGLQINFNIARIEEWCKSHDMPEGILQLEHLMQATKLLQLKKATASDIEIIQEICWMLSPNQVHKLLSQYLIADYEQPINGEVMKAVASRVADKSDALLLQAVDMDNSGPYEIAEPRQITALETYLPSYLQTPRLRRLADIVSASAQARADQAVREETTQLLVSNH